MLYLPNSTKPEGLADGLSEEGDGIAKSLDRLGSIVRNFDREFFFEGHYQLDLVERVRTQIVDEASLFDNLLGIHIEVFHNDLADPISDIAHIDFPFRNRGFVSLLYWRSAKSSSTVFG
jgi:hypothetical protein